MHVHGNHLNLNAMMETNATARGAASQRAAEVRKKLASGTSAMDADDAFRESLRIEEGEARSAGHPNRRKARQGSVFRAANISEDEEAMDQRTSLWA